MSETATETTAPVAPVPFEPDETPTLAKLADALAKAQGMMEVAKKDATNPHFNSKYADLASIWEAIRAPLSANGLAVVQRVRNAQGFVRITTMLLHASGEWIKDTSSWPVAQQTPQGFGSAITYAKRYTLAALVGIASDVDDDGNAASGKVVPKSGMDAVRDAVKSKPAPAPAAAPAAKPSDLEKQLAQSIEKKKAEKKPAHQDPALAKRFAALWERAKKDGMDAIAFQGFETRVLGGTLKPSSALTEDEMGHLESAYEAEAMEPGARG